MAVRLADVPPVLVFGVIERSGGRLYNSAGMWLVSADVTGERADRHVGFGPTSVMNPCADVVAQVPLMETGMVIAEIPAQLRQSG